VCFFGDGAMGQGLLYEVMNMAALWKLPVIYVCENNLYNEYTHNSETLAGDMLTRAAGFGIQGYSVDGQDVLDVRALGITASTFSASVSITVADLDGAGALDTLVTIGSDSMALFGVTGVGGNTITQADFILA
jgi:transketolase